MPDAGRARLILWLAFATMLLSVSIGLSWDAAWHTTRRFESAFSPPHLFIYVTTAVTCSLYLLLLTTPRLPAGVRQRLSRARVAYRVPGALFLTGSGLGLLALGAILDVVWHSTFGLDETRWSTPHALLGWGWSLAAFGFIAGHLALGGGRPLRWWTRAGFALLLLALTLGPIVGPFQNNQTREKVAAIASIPVLAEQPAYQHTSRIYLDWRIVRANPWFVILGAFWVGLVLVLLRSIDRRWRFIVAVIAVWSLFALLRERGVATRLGLDVSQAGHWLPAPLLPAALAAGLIWKSGRGHLLAGVVGGAVFGLLSLLAWPFGNVVGGAILGGICGGIGAFAGAALAQALHRAHGTQLHHPRRRLPRRAVRDRPDRPVPPRQHPLTQCPPHPVLYWRRPADSAADGVRQSAARAPGQMSRGNGASTCSPVSAS